MPRQWGGSSAGRALRSQCRGREFDPPSVHHFTKVRHCSGLFLFCLRASTCGAFGGRAKGGHRTKCSISGLSSFFVLSVLCFCEGRPSHAAFIWCGSRAGRMNRMLPGQWRPNRSRRPGNSLCQDQARAAPISWQTPSTTAATSCRNEFRSGDGVTSGIGAARS